MWTIRQGALRARMFVGGIGLGVLMMSALVDGAEKGGVGREEEALGRALRLVTLDPGVTVKLIDPELAPDPKTIGRLDAFVVRDEHGTLRRVIYLNRRAEIVRRAASGSGFYVAALAAVIHHETHHLRGADEREARQAEFEFFRSLLNDGHVQHDVGWPYLQLLTRQPRRVTNP